ncbi:LysR family transcriptional regulator [Hominifimenecus sp. rT4P-3]|uniref:LysR family transcriptional regulator n=1 Tax=Hominifimenecus sp. rT4P-3 TaxID=3242979 RepID=UPI003DA5C383
MQSFENFLVLCEELNYTKAAKRLGISQPSLSAYIKRLEESLGTKLFSKNRNSLTLTTQGVLVQNSAAQIMQLYSDIESVLTHKNQALVPPAAYTIGLARPLGSISKQILSLSYLSKLYPFCQFSITEGPYSAEMESRKKSLHYMLSNHEIDCVIFGALPSSPIPANAKLLFSLPEYLIISDELLRTYYPHKSPSTWIRGVDLLDFADIPQIAHSRNGLLQSKINQLFSNHNKRLLIPNIVNSPQIIYDLVKKGIGWSTASNIFLPEDRLSLEGVWRFPIVTPNIQFDYYILSDNSKRENAFFRQITRDISNYIRMNFSDSNLVLLQAEKNESSHSDSL